MKGEIFHISWVGSLGVVRIPLFSRHSQSKSHKVILWVMIKGIQSLHGEAKTQKSKHNIVKSKVGGLRLPDFKTYSIGIMIKTVCIGERVDRQISGTE